MRILGSLILLSTIAISACAHDPGAVAPAPAPDLPAPTPIPTPTTVLASEVTVENMLRWPLEGPTGIERVEAGLHQVLQMKSQYAQQFTGRGPVRLADGNVLGFAWIRRLSGSVTINLEQEPCVSPEYAVEVTEAIQSPVIRDMHGINRGKTYTAKRNGIEVDFTTTPGTYQCMTSIQMRPIRNPGS